MADFTPTQGRYLAYLHAYTTLHGYPPSESEMASAMCVSPPSVNQMVKMLEKKGLISRQPGRPRSLRVIIPVEEIPAWGATKKAPASASDSVTAVKRAAKSAKTVAHLPAESVPKPAAGATLYAFLVFLSGGPVGPKFRKKEISRVIEIRGDQTLDDLHWAIFAAYDRFDSHMYQFQMGKGPFDPKGPNYGVMQDGEEKDAKKTRIDDLKLKPDRVFGYWFDFGDDWMHQIQIERIEQAIPTVTYPRVTKRVGKSPPQYMDN